MHSRSQANSKRRRKLSKVIVVVVCVSAGGACTTPCMRCWQAYSMRQGGGAVPPRWGSASPSKVMGVLTHLDAFKEPSKIKKAKKALKVSVVMCGIFRWWGGGGGGGGVCVCVCVCVYVCVGGGGV